MITARVEYNKLPLKAAGLESVAGAAVRKVGFDIQAMATTDAPVDTGKLRAAHYTEIIGPTEVEVGNSADYAEYVNDGTRFMAARPFFTNAVERNRPVAAQVLAAMIKAHFES